MTDAEKDLELKTRLLAACFKANLDHDRIDAGPWVMALKECMREAVREAMAEEHGWGYRPCHPGAVLRGLYMEPDDGWSIGDLAEKSGLGAEEIGRLTRCEIPVDSRIAEGLDRALGTSHGMWINMQKHWDEENRNGEDD